MISRSKVSIPGVPDPLPIIKIRGSQPDYKHVLITAGLHGDEVVGIHSLHQFINNLKPPKLKGRLTIIPLANVSGFYRFSRYVAYDHLDLNRQFPGDEAGSPAQRIAWYISQLIQTVDLVIDLHDAGKTGMLIPHVRVHADPDNLDSCQDGCTLDIGHLFGLKFLFFRTGQPGMMAISSWKRFTKPVLTVELGGFSRLRTNVVQAGVRGIYNILRYLGMYPGRVVLPPVQYLLSHRTFWRAPFEGVLNLKVILGQKVKKGQLIAQLYNPISGKSIDIKALTDGLILSLNPLGHVKSGAKIGSMLAPQSDPNPHCRVVKIFRNKAGGKIYIRPGLSPLDF